MPTPERPALPSRWIRTLPWLGGLLLGTAAHLVWWTSTRAPERVVEVVTVPAASPTVHVHVYEADGDEAVPTRRPHEKVMTATQVAEADCQARERRALRHGLAGARGAVVCGSHGCTIRRSFVERMLHDPSLLAPPTRVVGVHGPSGPEGLRVLGVYPGSVPDLLGLRSGDVITEIEGMPMHEPGDLAKLGDALAERRGITVTLRRGELQETLRYRVIDG